MQETGLHLETKINVAVSLVVNQEAGGNLAHLVIRKLATLSMLKCVADCIFEI